MLVTRSVGTFALVLHTHLPWVAHHGAWPVGEEWLHQAWASCYSRVLDVLERLAQRGRSDLLTLGMTPVLAAQLDDPYSLANHHVWLGDWQTRALGQAASTANPLALDEYRQAGAALARFEQRWAAGGSAVVRPLVDSGAIELLGGPATHAFSPLLDERVLRFGLRTGLADAALRLGRAPGGIWAPECGYAPGIERAFAAEGVTHFLMDGPAFDEVAATTALGHPIGDSGVVAFARDLEVSYRVWSPTEGYPRNPWYRDFHTFDHDWGFRQSRVTDHSGGRKEPYQPQRALAAARADAEDFVGHVRRRLVDLAGRRGRPGLVVAAFDTELFGHWWHEGPVWLEHVLEMLPEAGVSVATLSGAVQQGLVGGAIQPNEASWGAGKKFQTWSGPAVAGIVDDNWHAQAVVLKTLENMPVTGVRSPVADQLARSLLLALASDWAFMITKDSAANYARERHFLHHSDTHRLAALLADHGAESAQAFRETALQRAINGPFGHLDARGLR